MVHHHTLPTSLPSFFSSFIAPPLSPLPTSLSPCSVLCWLRPIRIIRNQDDRGQEHREQQLLVIMVEKMKGAVESLAAVQLDSGNFSQAHLGSMS